MKKTSIVGFVSLLLFVQGMISSCCISPTSVVRMYYSVDNFKSLNRQKRFQLVALYNVSFADSNFPVEFHPGTVCLLVYGADSWFWAVKGSQHWRARTPSEGMWDFLDLTKSNWENRGTALHPLDSRVRIFENALHDVAYAKIGDTNIIDAVQVYRKIANCAGIVLIGKERYYLFYNSFNYYTSFSHRHHSAENLRDAFITRSGTYPHKVIAESDSFQDIEDSARRFAEETRMASDGNSQ